MSRSYKPEDDALPDYAWSVAYLSQRDVSNQIPINFVATPAISLTAACFLDKTYRGNETEICLSNVLASGFRRLILDLYWDDDRRSWSFCPVTLPNRPPDGQLQASSTSTLSNNGQSTSTARLSSSTAAAGDITESENARPATATSEDQRRRLQRRATTQTSDADSTANSAVPSASGSEGSPAPPEEPEYDLSPFTCSPAVDLSLFTAVLLDFIRKTDTTLDARLMYIVLNLHAAAPATAPSGDAVVPKNLPQTSGTLGAIFGDVFPSMYLYTPPNLRDERADLNSTWYSVSERYDPVGAYFTTDVDSSGFHSTPDGWPCEAYVEVTSGKRLIFGWGSVDAQMEAYNFSSDETTIFSRGDISKEINLSTSSSGDVESGCFFDSATKIIEKTNSSWAIAAAGNGAASREGGSAPSLSSTFNFTSNALACGISPVLDAALLLNLSTTQRDASAYLQLSADNVWSWAPGEPRNLTGSAPASACAVMDLSRNGPWRVEDCTRRYHAACRDSKEEPLSFVVSSATVAYADAASACSAVDADFAVPRTALENSYLLSAADDALGDGPDGVWIDLNSIDVQGCWVSGPDTSCPYYVDEDQVRQKNVIIPTVAAFIVLVLTGLTLFVKCNSNRRGSKRRSKKGERGWDYEG
ncbi:MAG: hypothetical protein M1825_004474 [Sarcosagium campestre]|nr:MAG: hypothetical protein M1825_004474 [Sarcosagium campestre]